MKAKLVEIVKVRHYKRPKKLVCLQCDNCLKIPLMYCLVDNKFKLASKRTNCPFYGKENK